MKKFFLNRTLLSIGLVGFLFVGCELENISPVTDPKVDRDQEDIVAEQPTEEETQTPEDTSDTSNEFKVPAFNETKAFPSAEGYGRFTKGGRGGRTVYVTSLEDNSNPGTLRYALEVVSEPRTVLFKVSGIIELNSVIKIKDPYVTIAGQTAPGSGITIKNAAIQVETHDIIIRNIRLRPGDSSTGEAPSDRDAFRLYKNRNCHNIMLDQVSFTWGIDENVDFSTGSNNVTIQKCIIAEGLSNSLHEEGEHSKGILMLNDLDNISIVNNLFAHNMNRNPLMSSNSRNIHVVNNLIYNWGHMAPGYGTHCQIFKDEIPINDAVIFRNVYRKGETSHDVPLYRTGNFYLVDGSSFFIDENYMDENGTLHDLKDVSPSYNKYTDFYTFIMESAPSGWSSGYSEIHQADNVVDYVLSNAGARKPILDAVDERIIEESRNFTGNFVDSPSDRGGYPEQYQGTVPTDSDEDGIPDKWENAKGLDPEVSGDAQENTLSPYYTNLEMYLNELAGDYTL
ncbi:pectate lyase family protein [Marinilabilia rubra]|uniref:Pectate lyase n=1 Tax=Marinilabilia rubra TaxID=2162893 RepID=A0A2U2B7D5_9BACT|nr:pectate lyase [Marinilabilia rubra]PWD98989.1 pectate lyase [Marinilabilia rubra]